MQVKSIQGFQCICEARGIEREVSLFMLQEEDIAPGDYVLIHVGYAIQKVTEVEAASSWEMFDEILAADA
jgi:hydrogenase expression/formation protein HypC